MSMETPNIPEKRKDISQRLTEIEEELFSLASELEQDKQKNKTHAKYRSRLRKIVESFLLLKAEGMGNIKPGDSDKISEWQEAWKQMRSCPMDPEEIRFTADHIKELKSDSST